MSLMVEIVTQIKSGTSINVCVSATCSCKNGKHAWIICDLVVKCDEIIEQTKAILTKSNPTNNKKQ